MITFTDPRKYVLGVGVGIMTDPATNDIVYFSDKFQDASITLSSSDQVMNAGIGNAPAIIIPTDPNVTVNVTAGDYSEYVKAASVGASISYAAPVMTCIVWANSAGGVVNLSEYNPVAGPGMSAPVCYIQKSGEASPIATDGVAYAIDPTTKVITGFTADPGQSYVITFYQARANASMTTITSNIKGKVVRFVFQRPIYVNFNTATNRGDMWGMLYEIVPRLQLMPDGASNAGGQTAFTTTGITGRAMMYDAETVSADACNECSLNGAPLMYRVIVPCDTTEGIDGILGALGGAVSVVTGESVQLTPAVVVNDKLSYNVPPTSFAYSSSATGVATVGAATGIVAGVSAGSAEVTVTYTVGSETYTDYVNVEVTSA